MWAFGPVLLILLAVSVSIQAAPGLHNYGPILKFAGRRTLDELGGDNGNGRRTLDELGGDNGNGRRTLDGLGDDNLNGRRTLDDLGGDNLNGRSLLFQLSRYYPEFQNRRSLDGIGGGNLNGRRSLDGIGGGNLNGRSLDGIGGANDEFGMSEPKPSRSFDVLKLGGGYGLAKRFLSQKEKYETRSEKHRRGPLNGLIPGGAFGRAARGDFSDKFDEYPFFYQKFLKSLEPETRLNDRPQEEIMYPSTNQ